MIAAVGRIKAGEAVREVSARWLGLHRGMRRVMACVTISSVEGDHGVDVEGEVQVRVFSHV